MTTKMIPCEVETPDGRLPRHITSIAPILRGLGEVVVAFDGYDEAIKIPLDDLTDDSRRLILNSRKI